MAARGFIRKTFFPPNVVTCLRCKLFLRSRTPIFQTISKEKKFFKPLYLNLYENIWYADVAIDPYPAKKQQGKNKSSGFARAFHLASLTLGYLWYYSSTAHAANDDGDKENTAGSERCKGRFVSRGHLSAVKKLAKGKDNLKRPIAEEHNGERDYEPTEKKVTRSKQVCFSYRGKLLQMLQSSSHFYTLYDAIEYSSKHLSCFSKLKTKN